ncbi:MAG: VOC family protein [Woeseiaceae bacterium]|nr:VOC family protein [Woeseiaceae bacterium]
MAEAISYAGGLTISMPVSDLQKSIDWYQKVLGFELQYRMDDIGWCELVSPVADVTVGLSVVEKPNPGGATPTFGVSDIQAARASLEKNGVRIDGDPVTIENMVSLLTFYDVDENSLMLFQMLSDND